MLWSLRVLVAVGLVCSCLLQEVKASSKNVIAQFPSVVGVASTAVTSGLKVAFVNATNGEAYTGTAREVKPTVVEPSNRKPP
jgi:hypothetical protein